MTIQLGGTPLNGTYWSSAVGTVVGMVQNVDNTATLQAAINNASAYSTIIIPPGTYLLDAVFILKPLEIKGSGRGVTVIQPNTITGPSKISNGVRIFHVGSDDVEISDMSFIGTIPAGTTNPLTNTYLDQNSADVYPAAWIFSGSISLDVGYKRGRFYNLYISGGIVGWVGNYTQDATFRDCTCEDQWQSGISCGPTKYTTISNCRISRSRWNECIALGASIVGTTNFGHLVESNVLENGGYLGGQENFDQHCLSGHDIICDGNLFISDFVWTGYGFVPTVTGAATFTVPLDVTSTSAGSGTYGYYANRIVMIQDSLGTQSIGIVNNSVFGAGVTTVTLTSPTVALNTLIPPLTSYNNTLGGGSEIKTEGTDPTISYERIIFNGNKFKLAGTKHAIDAHIRSGPNPNAKNLLFSGNLIVYDSIPLNGTYGAVEIDGWHGLDVIGNTFINAYFCVHPNSSTGFGDDTAPNISIINNRARNCRNGVYVGTGTVPSLHLRNNDFDVLDYGYRGVTGTTCDDLIIEINRIRQIPDGSSDPNSCPVYIADGNVVSIMGNRLRAAARYPIVIGLSGSNPSLAANVFVNYNRLTADSTSVSAIAIYNAPAGLITVEDNDIDVASNRSTWTNPSGGAPSNVNNGFYNNRGFISAASGAPTSGAVGDYFIVRNPSASNPYKWVCVTAGEGGTATFKSVSLGA